MQSGALYFTQIYMIRSPIVELGGASRGVVGHRCRLLQRTAVVQVCSNAGGTERVVANEGIDLDRFGSAADHGVRIGLR